MDLNAISLDVALANLASAFSSIQQLLVAISYVSGIYFVYRGIGMYRIFANQTMGSAQRGEFAGPLVFIVVGAILIYLPSTVDTSMQSLYGSSEVAGATDFLAYSSVAKDERWAQLTDVLMKYMKLIGLIAFIRGWFILSKMGNSGSQPGSMGKGVTHIIGGVLLMNIVETMNILAQTFGFAR
jgi:intracellular multiplication protein IcmC